MSISDKVNNIRARHADLYKAFNAQVDKLIPWRDKHGAVTSNVFTPRKAMIDLPGSGLPDQTGDVPQLPSAFEVDKTV